jgi:uncharacterized protein YdeI (YjbR/CyaY-like superfamily)
MTEITKTFYPIKASDWRGWLEKNHQSKKEVWVVFYKKSTGKQTVSYHQVLDQALCFGWIDGIEKGIDKEKYAIRFTPRSSKSRWSEINVKRYKELLKQGLVVEAGKIAFKKKIHVYTSFSNKKGPIEWHLSHKMPKNPSLEMRINWHKEHHKYCDCRPISKKLLPYF